MTPALGGGLGGTPCVEASDMHLCLIEAYRMLRWINKNSPTYKAELAYRNLTTLDEQMSYLKPYLQGIQLDIEEKFTKAPTWNDVLHYAEEEWRIHGNGVLLMWMVNVKEFGHAVAVMEGKVQWGEKTCGYDLTMTFGSDFICKYIFVDTFI